MRQVIHEKTAPKPAAKPAWQSKVQSPKSEAQDCAPEAKSRQALNHSRKGKKRGRFKTS